MSSYKFSPDQFICTKDPEDMEEWVNRYGKSQVDDKGKTMKYEDYPEIKRNCEYRKKYSTLAAQEKMYDDTKATYDKTWRQTANLSLGIFILLIGIYYQK